MPRLNHPSLSSLLLIATFSASAAFAQDVNCGAGGTGIQAAINSGDNFVTFVGTPCDEHVFIGRDGVTLQGQGPAVSQITQGVTVSGGTNVRLQNFAVIGDPAALTDPSFFTGLFIIDGAFADIEDLSIQGTTEGLDVFRNAGAEMRRTTIDLSDVDDASLSCAPVCVFESSTLRIFNSTLTADIDDPFLGPTVQAFRDASIVIRGGNVITNTGTQGAVGAFFDSSIQQDDFFDIGTDQINGGLEVFGDAFMGIRQANVTGGANVGLHSVLRIGSGVSTDDATQLVVDGPIQVSRDSAVVVDNDEATLNSAVTCVDAESSFSGSFQGDGTVDCTGFHQAEFEPVAPCRLVDTRASQGGTGSIIGGDDPATGDPRDARSYTVTGDISTNEGAQPADCGAIPTDSESAVLTITVVTPANIGFLTVFNAGLGERPFAASMVYDTQTTILSNTVAVNLCDDCVGDDEFTIFSSASVDVVVDLVGVFRTSDVE